MAKFEFQMPDDFIKQLGKLADVDRLAPKMLEGAAPILVRTLKAKVANTQQSELGDMYKSIKMSKTYSNKNGHFLVVRPTGKDKYGKRNMDKFAYMEFGTSKQPARPMMQAAINDAKTEVLDKMQEIFNEEVSK